MELIGKLFLISAEAAEQLVDDPTGILALLGADEESDDELDLDRTWHGLHFLLTGSATDGDPPLNFLVAGGEEIGLDLGSGQVRLFDAAAVKRIDVELTKLTKGQIVGRLDPDVFEEPEIYGANRDDPLDELQQEYGEAFDRLQTFVGRAAIAGQAIVVTVL